MNTKRKLITIIIGIEIIIIAAMIVFLFYINSDTVRINRQLELAQRYLLEEDYEQAIAAFEIVIEIDPKNVDAYLGLAEAYVSKDELKNAVRTLEKAAKQTDSEEVLDMLEIQTAKIEQRQLAAQKAADAEALATAVSITGDTANNLQQDNPTLEALESVDSEFTVQDRKLESESPNEPYRSYLKILQDHRWQILKYSSWAGATLAPIAFYDIVGDGIPELIYVSITPETLDEISWKTSLNIVTWQNGQTKLLYTGDWDYNAEAGLGYFLFYVKEDNALYSYENYGGWQTKRGYYKFSLGNDQNIIKENILFESAKAEVQKQSDDVNWIWEFTYNGKNVSQDEYDSAEYELLSKTDAVIMVSDGFIQSIANGYVKNRTPRLDIINNFDNQAMIYEEAIDYLEGFLDENEKSWQQGELIEGNWLIEGNRISDENLMRITDIKGSHFLCELSIYRACSFDFIGLFDANNHATLYDKESGVFGEITIDTDHAVITLQDMPHFYFDQSLSEFIGTQFRLEKQE